MVTQQTLLNHAAVCSRLLHTTNDPRECLLLWELRECGKALAVDGLGLPDLDEQVEALVDAEARVFAEIRPALH